MARSKTLFMILWAYIGSSKPRSMTLDTSIEDAEKRAAEIGREQSERIAREGGMTNRMSYFVPFTGAIMEVKAAAGLVPTSDQDALTGVDISHSFAVEKVINAAVEVARLEGFTIDLRENEVKTAESLLAEPEKCWLGVLDRSHSGFISDFGIIVIPDASVIVGENGEVTIAMSGQMPHRSKDENVSILLKDNRLVPCLFVGKAGISGFEIGGALERGHPFLFDQYNQSGFHVRQKAENFTKSLIRDNTRDVLTPTHLTFA